MPSSVSLLLLLLKRYSHVDPERCGSVGNRQLRTFSTSDVAMEHPSSMHAKWRAQMFVHAQRAPRAANRTDLTHANAATACTVLVYCGMSRSGHAEICTLLKSVSKQQQDPS
ncbi:hypothetical protein JG688_00009561 [Phytophthora aleatoria]|uniref:Secreted protein n=1 Tax=Phytophthora aleatoria TaxID=2496075 RepID=A0A8J5IX47_9STRA|nr:hypothetical protein JG688_00009561 [Phytophthora aleatoria]